MTLRSILATLTISGVLLNGVAINAAPSAIDVLVQKARSLEARDRADLAAQVWQQVLIANPKQPDALAGLARWAKRTGKVDEANSYIAKLRALDPNSSALMELDNNAKPASSHDGRLDEAARLTAQHRYDDAMRIYREVFGAKPPAGGWALAYYETLSQTPGGLEPAVAALKQLAVEHPELPDYQITAGRLLTYQPATRAAGVSLLASVQGSGSAASKSKEAWRQALVWEKGNRAYLPAFRTYLARYQDPEVQAIVDALNAQPAAVAAGIPFSKDEQLGYAALKQNNVTEAEEKFTSALSETPNSSEALAGLGFVRMKQTNFSAAVEQFKAALAQRPKSGELKEALQTARFWQKMQSAAEEAKQGNSTAAIEGYNAALTMRSSNTEALRGLAGAYMLAGQSDKAVALYQRLVNSQPKNADFWEGLVRAKAQAGDAHVAVQALSSLPPGVSAQLAEKRAFQILQVSIYADAGQDERAARIFEKLDATGISEKLDATGISELPLDSQVELASLLVRFHRPEQAVESLEKLLAQSPDFVGGWEVLISALAAEGKNDLAQSAVEEMPETARRAALLHPGFLQTMAALQAAAGKPDEAKAFLQRILDMPDSSASQKVKLDARTQLAPLLVKTGQGDEARSMIKEILEARPNDSSAWKANLSILADEHRDHDLLLTASRMPDAVTAQLRRDPDVVRMLASAQVADGSPDAGIQLLQTYMAQSVTGRSQPPADLEIQLCWLLLNAPGRQRQLYTELQQMRSRTDLSSAQQKDVSNIWITWIVRSADAAAKQNDPKRSMALLQEGLAIFPGDVRLQRSLAGNLLKAGDTKRALNLYSNWGLADAQPADFAGAIGAALSQKNYQFADAWLDKALTKWPRDAQLLTLAGERARGKGDLKRAEAYWRDAAAVKKSAPVAISDGASQASESRLASLLVGSDAPASNRPAVRQVSNLERSFFASTTPAAHLTGDSSLNALPPVTDSRIWVQTSPDEPAGVEPKTLGSLAARQSLVSSEPGAADPENLDDRLASIESRNSPYFGSQTVVQGRSGQAGFDRLLIQQSDFEASSTVANSVRVTLAVKPTYLDSGTADGSSTLRFGSSAAGTGFGPQSASGLAVDTQISSQTFGLHVGTSPQGFLTHEILGGFRFQPANGPITVIVQRDNVTETMLSYAGARDPVTNKVFGGVVTNNGTLLGHWGDDKSGIYASVGYASLTGKNVAGNRAVNGTFGTYWKLYSRKEGSLTLGTNFSAMHYDKNLRYFTLGQGGYFSPQQYYLFGVPFRWTGTYNNRLQYIISGSLGIQHFEEDESAFFPLNGKAQPGELYPMLSSTGANFSFDARVNYQLTPHWYIGAFADANNSRNYTASSAGIFVKYNFEARPLGFENPVASVPDWRGQQPFSLF